MLTQNFKLVFLAALITLGLIATAQATSVITGYQANHFATSNWRVTQIDGQNVTANDVPMLHFQDGVVIVSQGCHSFRMLPDPTRAPSATRLEFITSTIACAPASAQQALVITLFADFPLFHLRPDGSLHLRTHSGHYLLADSLG